MIHRIAPSQPLVLLAGLAALLVVPASVVAQQPVKIPQAAISYEENPTVTFPLVICWNNGKKNLYIQTDASDPTVSRQQKINYVPQLSNAIDAPNGAVDDIYVFTNSTQKDQYNVLPSEPQPVGPLNTNIAYSPLWRISNVTWKQGARQTTLKSEQEVLDAASAGLVTLDRTRIILNCPVLYTDSGGLLPRVVVRLNDGDRDGGGTYRNR